MAIINKAELNFVDIYTGNILSNEVSFENEETSLYLHNKIEKLKTLNMCKVIAKDDNAFFNKDKFNKIALVEFCKASQQSIFENNFYLLTIDLTDDFANDVNIMIKLDLEKNETIINKDNELMFGYTLSTPKSNAGIKEAIIVDNTNKDIYVIEKKVQIDGKKDFYISNHILNAGVYASYKKLFDLYLKTIKYVNEQYFVCSEIELISNFFEYVEECKVTEKYLTVENISNRLFDDEEDAKKLFVNRLEDILNEEETKIPTVLLSKELSSINIKTSDVQIKVSCDLASENNAILLQNNSIVIQNNEHCKIG